MKKVSFALASVLSGGALFADGTAGSFIPTSVSTAVSTALSNAQTDVSDIITSNYTTIIALLGIMLAIPLAWFIWRIVKRVLGKA